MEQERARPLKSSAMSRLTPMHAHSKRGVSQVKFSVSHLPISLLSLSGDEGDHSFAAAASWLSALKPVTCEVGSAAFNAAIAFKTLSSELIPKGCTAMVSICSCCSCNPRVF